MSHELCELGIVGLTTLGQSFAAHHASNKTRVCVADEDPSFVPQVINEYKTQMEAAEDRNSPLPLASCCMLPSDNLEELVARLASPRKILVFGTHDDDRKFEDVWNKICPALEMGDMVLRWGKEGENDRNIQFYNDSICRVVQLQHPGLHVLEMVRLECERKVVMEGETPEVFMVGGPREAYEQMEPFISPCASIAHVGNDAGCAHYAHMIQRVIENGVTQVIAEASDILSKAAGFEHQDIGRIMNKWNEGEERLSSYLLYISGKILYKRDKISNKGFVLEHIVDSVDLNAVDTWVTLEATKLGIPAPTINATLESRFLSMMKVERLEASSILKVPEHVDTPSVMKEQISNDLGYAIYCACICLFAECLAIFQAASDLEHWDANMVECIRLWSQPGSLLESTLMAKIHTTLVKSTTQHNELKNGDEGPKNVDEDEENEDKETKNLMILPEIASELQELHMSWRRIVTLSFASAIPCPTLSSSLTYYDSYRARMLPTGLIRAQRDFFDGFGYSRFDREGWFTTCWLPEHTKARKKKEAEDAAQGAEGVEGAEEAEGELAEEGEGDTASEKEPTPKKVTVRKKATPKKATPKKRKRKST